MNSLKLISKLLIAISLIPYSLFLMGFAIYISLNTSFFLNSAVKTNGVVIGLVPHGNKGTYTSKYSFSDENGLTYTGVHNVYSKPAVYGIGEPVEVLYDPQFPQNSVIDDGSVHDYSSPTGMFLSGLISLLMVILMFKHL
jgi:hypothetical protein